MKKQIRVGNVGYNGQEPKGGITYKVVAGAEKGDIVGPTANPGEVERPAAGKPFVGELVTLERDGVGSVHRGEVTIARRTGAITPGFTELATDGTGGVQAAASAGTGTRCHVIATDADSVAFYIL
ncbi:hypothetical protein [Deinococcus radiophilus]|uniref:hypothetical protein n=1 Tax=Deinococcus radiophilus TaxID=32062 RepID=UPI001E4231D7|nr:hypothetical protein [Deinococcus radiophilus]UFA49644.1 hypothetical protein LMT64_06990 [Deinococcus radiophilus]